MKTTFVAGLLGVILIGILSGVLIWKGTPISKLCSAPSGEHAKCDKCRTGRC
jgi:hypothetical protein